jgi:hypothetical protein
MNSFLDLQLDKRQDPLLLIASEMSYAEVSRGTNELTLHKTTICPSLPSLPAILAMLVFPAIQTVKDTSKREFSLRVFKKCLDGKGRLEGVFPITVEFDQEDIDCIKRCRSGFDDFVSGSASLDRFQLRKDVLWLIKRERKKLNLCPVPDISHLSTEIDVNLCQFIETEWTSVTLPLN